PPHNLREVTAAEVALIDNPDIEVGELMELLPGPDFPTGGIIAGRNGIVQAYTKGRGRIRVKAVVEEEYIEKKDQTRFIITELPYQVNKAMLVEQIANCVKNKQVEGIRDLRDESDRTGMRVVIELKKDATPEVVLNSLWKHTRMQTTFSIINISLVDNEPLTLPLKDMLQYHIEHRQIVVRKRTEFDLKKAEERAHLLEGLKIALDNIDKVIALIKKAKNAEIARAELITNYGLDEIQANAILDMKLQRLTGLERQKLLDELSELKKKITSYKAILADETKILTIIKEELEEVSEKYGDSRRTQIQDVEDEEIDLEDLIEPEEMVVTISNQGYIKRMSLDLYRAQGRGGKGIRGATTKEDDFIAQLYIANTHDTMLIFTSKGRVHWKKVYQVPESGRQSKGRPIINLIPLDKDEFVRSVIKVNEFKKDNYLLFVTRDGTVKKTSLVAYSRPRQGGIIAIKLVNGNDVVTVLKTNGDNQVLVASRDGAAVKFHENDVRDMGRNAAGVRGIKLRTGDKVVGAIKASDEKNIFTITENGYGKRTAISEYRLINRGGLGVRNIKCTPRNGKVVSIKSLSGGEEIMLASKNGTVIRMFAENISKIGRDTQGVRVMAMRGDDKVMACAKIVSEDADMVEESEEE
ncbi:DNA gyrase subunit A, partial [Candidatus Woesearchaeota archaeon]|nr:DNA gyrase subunit A [Candidatus Woesearchaeota archaeon]